MTKVIYLTNLKINFTYIVQLKHDHFISNIHICKMIQCLWLIIVSALLNVNTRTSWEYRNNCRQVLYKLWFDYLSSVLFGETTRKRYFCSNRRRNRIGCSNKKSKGYYKHYHWGFAENVCSQKTNTNLITIVWKVNNKNKIRVDIHQTKLLLSQLSRIPILSCQITSNDVWSLFVGAFNTYFLCGKLRL